LDASVSAAVVVTAAMNPDVHDVTDDLSPRARRPKWVHVRNDFGQPVELG